MSAIRTVLDKLAAEGFDKLSDEERKVLADYREVDVEKLANDRAAKARLEAEKRLQVVTEAKAEADRQLVTLQEKLDAASGKEKTELEKLQTKLEKLAKELETERVERTKSAVENARLVRDHKLDAIFAKFTNSETQKLAPGVDPTDARALLGLRLGELDLDDEELVGQHLDKFRDRNKAWFVTPDGAGTGSGGGGAGGGGTGGGGGGRRQTTVSTADLLEVVQSGSLADAEAAVKAARDAVAGGAKME